MHLAAAATHDPWPAWRAAAARPEVADALARLRRSIADDTARRGPVCRNSGRCCRFASYGHRLYVTGLEVAAFEHERHVNTNSNSQETKRDKKPCSPASLPVLTPQDAVATDACPYQRDNLCTAHDARPLGCRVFFCDAEGEAWPNELYERVQHAVRDLHDELGVPYVYADWRALLAEARASSPSAPASADG